MYTDESSAFAIIPGALYTLPSLSRLKNSMTGAPLPDNISITRCKKAGELPA
ncbi:MAG: hypothetical protein Q7T80_10065 [Methanoregula sp.]|nr:hypothetical protein [Methanoregula sp.]